MPPSTLISVPSAESASRLLIVKRETLAILGKASPRNPKVAIPFKSSEVRSLLVAWRSNDFAVSCSLIPQPSSLTRSIAIPPRWISISIFLAPASMAFSTSSFMTLAGRSITSPAATWLARVSGITSIVGIASAYSMSAKGQLQNAKINRPKIAAIPKMNGSPPL